MKLIYSPKGLKHAEKITAIHFLSVDTLSYKHGVLKTLSVLSVSLILFYSYV